MQRVSGGLWKVVTYESQTARGLLLGEVPAHLIWRECIACNFYVTIYSNVNPHCF